MARFSFVVWDGGGNLGPAIGLAQALTARGHRCRFLGYRAQRAHVERQRLAFDQLARSGDFDLHGAALAPALIAALIARVWVCHDHLADLPEALARDPADAVIVDCMMHGALAAAQASGLPTAVFVHTAIAGLVAAPGTPMAIALAEKVSAVRQAAGLPAVELARDAWRASSTLVTTIGELDPAMSSAGERAHYVGPIVEAHPEASWQSPWPADDPRPLVVASFSTTGLWDQRGRIARTLEALAGKPVRLLLCGPETTDLQLPANAAARRFVPHAAVLPDARAMITHCGHGTVCAALAHGVPIVGLPNRAADQPFLAQRLEALGAGLALDGEQVTAGELRAAVRRLLDEPSHAAAARRLSAAIAAAPGATGAAEILERLLG